MIESSASERPSFRCDIKLNGKLNQVEFFSLAIFHGSKLCVDGVNLDIESKWGF